MQLILFTTLATTLVGITRSAPQPQFGPGQGQGQGPPQTLNNPNPNVYSGTQTPQGTITPRQFEQIPILRLENVNNGDGSYNFNYETGNGITAQESGYLKNPGTDNEIQTVSGFYQYYTPENQLLRLDYTADENGFVARGDHLPTPPPIPEAIQKALAIIYANAEKQIAAKNRSPPNPNVRY